MNVEYRIPYDSNSDLIVMSSRAKMPSSCKGSYRRVGLLRVSSGARPKMISERAHGVWEILRLRERLHSEGGRKTAYARAAEELCELADSMRLNRAIKVLASNALEVPVGRSTLEEF